MAVCACTAGVDMTQDEIIDKLLFQAGAHFGGDGINYEEFDFRKFAKLVAAKEREACAVACEKELEYWGWNIVFDSAKLIRARAGNKND
jgi:hypothetical protein